MSNSIKFEDLRTLETFVYRTCMYMNNEDWSKYLSLCDSDHFRYRVVNYSPEIRREQCWADRSYSDMATAFSLMSKHNTDHSKLVRHATVRQVTADHGTKRYETESTLVIYKTLLDGTNAHLDSGKTQLYAVGEYSDVIAFDDDNMRLVSRTVNLHTRQLDIGTHKPF